jgi:hypothetical protein
MSIAAKRRIVQICLMKEVTEVIVKVQIVSLDVEVELVLALLGAPLQGRTFENLCFVGYRRISHPDPDCTVMLNRGIPAKLYILRNDLLAWNANTFAGFAICQTVIAAHDRIVDDSPVFQRHPPMRATAGQRRDVSLPGAKQDDRLIEYRSADGLLVIDLA